MSSRERTHIISAEHPMLELTVSRGNRRVIAEKIRANRGGVRLHEGAKRDFGARATGEDKL